MVSILLYLIEEGFFIIDEGVIKNKMSDQSFFQYFFPEISKKQNSVIQM